MYKLLLCWRYLRTRYIALASIISVTLGVATMIVVNSVMAGFSHEMQNRIHNILSDVVFESHSLEGFHDPTWHMEEIRRLAGDDIAGMTPTVLVPGMLSFRVRDQWITRQVQIIGVDEATHSQVADWGRYLQHPQNREQLSFQLYEGGYDTTDSQSGSDEVIRPQMKQAGWEYRRQRVLYDQAIGAQAPPPAEASFAATEPAPASGTVDPFSKRDPFAASQPAENVFDPSKDQHTGVVLGIALASYRGQDGKDRFLVLPGDDVRLTFPTAGTPPKAISDVFTISDFYESKMSEYDSQFVFLPLKKVQALRGMINPSTGIGNVTSIQIKLKEGVDLNRFRDKLRGHFPPELYGIFTWRDKQGPLMAAVQMETAILNVLLFLIIAVAGFGILAIFFMIVVEKTRDIGILKSLGASSRGIMGIFLAYGLSLGIVGAGAGLVLGLLFVIYINEIANFLSMITGQPLFDPTVYYFQQIPTIIDPMTVVCILIGALLIAIFASILPARRAARLHPVEALRHE